MNADGDEQRDRVHYAHFASELEVWRVVVDRLEQLLEAHREETAKGEDTGVWFGGDEDDVNHLIVQALHLHFCYCTHAVRANPSKLALEETLMRLWDFFENGACAYDIAQRPVRVVVDVEAS